jgi:hypothetical protein
MPLDEGDRKVPLPGENSAHSSMKGRGLLRATPPDSTVWLDAEELQVTVTPAKAGVQNSLKRLDSCFRRNDDLEPQKDNLLELALLEEIGAIGGRVWILDKL